MSLQSWIVLGIAAAVVLACAGRFRRTLARRGEGAGCCCDGRCGKPRRRPAPPRP
jgi:hypothetical protein